jgi:hypothetical protein
MRALVLLLCAAFVILWAYAQGVRLTGLIAIAMFATIMIGYFARKMTK